MLQTSLNGTYIDQKIGESARLCPGTTARLVIGCSESPIKARQLIDEWIDDLGHIKPDIGPDLGSDTEPDLRPDKGPTQRECFDAWVSLQQCFSHITFEQGSSYITAKGLVRDPSLIQLWPTVAVGKMKVWKFEKQRGKERNSKLLGVPCFYHAERKGIERATPGDIIGFYEIWGIHLALLTDCDRNNAKQEFFRRAAHDRLISFQGKSVSVIEDSLVTIGCSGMLCVNYEFGQYQVWVSERTGREVNSSLVGSLARIGTETLDSNKISKQDDMFEHYNFPPDSAHIEEYLWGYNIPIVPYT